MEVKSKILVWLDDMVNKFVDSLRLIETQSPKLKEYIGEDKRTQKNIETMRADYMRVINIFNEISDTPTQEKQAMIEKHRPEMKKIETEIDKIDKHLTKRVGGLKESLKKTVSFGGL